MAKTTSLTSHHHQSSKTLLSRNQALWHFSLIFSLVTMLYYAVTLLPWFDQRLFPAYLRTNAHAANVVLNCLGQPSHAESTTIRSPRFSITIKRGCDALEPSWLFCAAVFAFPASWRLRLPGLVAGISLILTLNVVRIVSLYFLGIYSPALFETMHLEIWPVLFIAVALYAWLFWVRWIRRTQYTNTHGPV